MEAHTDVKMIEEDTIEKRIANESIGQFWKYMGYKKNLMTRMRRIKPIRARMFNQDLIQETVRGTTPKEKITRRGTKKSQKVEKINLNFFNSSGTILYLKMG